MDSQPPPSGHSVIGCIHELSPLDDSLASLEAVLRHECDECDGARVVIDLTDHPSVDSGHIQLMVELIDPTGDRWSIMLPSNVEPETIRALDEAGFRHLITVAAET